MNKIIELKNVSKMYQRGTEEVHAVEGISLAIDQGDFVSFVGSSGSGKTTLLNMIGCVDKPTSGSIILDGVETNSLKDNELTKIRSSKIGFVFQQFFLLPTLTALENVELPILFGKKKGVTGKAEELLALVDLKDRKNHLPSQLSGGEMQRVAIARALANEPKIILADEPTGNLDSRNAEKIMGIFKKLNDDGQSIIMVTHNIELAKRAKRTVYLRDGKIFQGHNHL